MMIEVLEGIRRDFALEMGFGTCIVHGTLHFTWASPKTHENHLLNGLLRLKSEELFTWVGLGTWDHV